MIISGSLRTESSLTHRETLVDLADFIYNLTQQQWDRAKCRSEKRLEIKMKGK